MFNKLGGVVRVAKKGVDPVVGFLLVTAMIVASTALVGPAIKKQISSIKMAMAFEKGKQEMLKIRDAVEDVASHGGSRILDIELDKGHITFSSGDNLIYFSIPAGFALMPVGYVKEENGLMISAGSAVEVRNASDIEIENEAIVAKFLRAGSPDSPALIDVRNILKETLLKKTGKKVYPDIDVIIGGKNQTFGYGYVYAVTTGYGKNQGRVVAKISSKDYNYTLLYIIPSGADYVVVKIRDIRKNS